MTHDAELTLLRAFYESWVALHTIPRDGMHRRQQEEAAQIMTDNAHAVRRLYQGTQPAVERKPQLAIVGSMDCARAEATNG